MLGNKVGGDRILDAANIKTARACLYRAYAALGNIPDDSAARRGIEEGRCGGKDDRFDRLESLMSKASFRVMFYYDYHNGPFIEGLKNLPGFDVIAVLRI